MTIAVVVTGASRGFGRCLALDFCRQITNSDVDMYLWARNEVDLRESKRLLREAWEQKECHGGDYSMQVSAILADLGHHGDYAPKTEALLEELKARSYDSVYLVHNAGSHGDLCYSQEWNSHEMLTQFWETNVTSLFWINQRFLDVYGATREELTSDTPAAATGTVLTLLNITSICAIEPFSTHGLYCAGKAAREMHFRVIAKEQPASRVRVLSYSPGPMDTDMQMAVRESNRVDKELRKLFVSMHADGELIDPRDSSSRCVEFVLSDKFDNGTRSNYYSVAGVDAGRVRDIVSGH